MALLDERQDLGGPVGAQQQAHIVEADPAVGQGPVAQPLQQAVPLPAPRRITGKSRIVPVWMSVSASNSSSSVPNPPGQMTKAHA